MGLCIWLLTATEAFSLTMNISFIEHVIVVATYIACTVPLKWLWGDSLLCSALSMFGIYLVFNIFNTRSVGVFSLVSDDFRLC